MQEKKQNKRIVFESTTHKHAQLKVRLEYDSLTQAEFFRCLIDGYLNKDTRILKFIESYKQQKGKDSKRNTKYRTKDLQKGEELLEKFGIKDAELENIFDLIEEEFPDL
mgnify:FL=1|jgi:hypothetical protein|tara:strand:- start:269 stop:595 length:327 start_codon:yes stop_codon:yes gene_type:complete